jgi:hypothetical protein
MAGFPKDPNAQQDVLDFELDDIDGDDGGTGFATGIPVVGSGHLGSFSYSVGVGAMGSNSIGLAPAVEKSRISYVVVCNDGHTLELAEQQSLTAREMIGIAKFINTVTGYAMALAAGANIVVVWSELINKLGIQRHFTAGLDVDQYDEDGDVLHIFLVDP